MELKAFQLGLRSVTAALPYGKKLQNDEIAFLFMTLPSSVKDGISDHAWAYACGKALADPSPDKELPIHMRVLSYLYRMENGRPNFEWGLKPEVSMHLAFVAAAEAASPKGLLDAE